MASSAKEALQWRSGRQQVLLYVSVVIVALCSNVAAILYAISQGKGLSLHLLVSLMALAGATSLFLIALLFWSRCLGREAEIRARELADERNYLQRVIRGAKIPLVGWDPTGNITLVNQAFEKMSGWTEETLSEEGVESLFPEEECYQSLRSIEKTAIHEYWEKDPVPILRRDNQIHPVWWNMTNIYTEDGNRLIANIAVAQDINSQVPLWDLEEAAMNTGELNAQLILSDKMAALGKMAAGIGHEINNPLAVIFQITGWMKDLLVEEDLQKSKNFEEYRASIAKIDAHIRRARTVVHNMLAYAGRLEPRPDKADINEIMNRAVGVLENYARINDIEISVDLSPDLPSISADQQHLEQVFFSLISNAIDAVEKDGLIEIKTRLMDASIIISIRDDGPGIPIEEQGKVFDPFYTTKVTGKGTGLGLWVNYNIIRKMGGSIVLKSKAGEGATFTVNIPIHPNLSSIDNHQSLIPLQAAKKPDIPVEIPVRPNCVRA
ncbi:MAG: PAS domain S-box protein [Deltaproteobacteria bacterium]|nr:PAS domain S-box protein [Deltaproteobacteria bacterium]